MLMPSDLSKPCQERLVRLRGNRELQEVLAEFLRALEPVPRFVLGKPGQEENWKYKSAYRDAQKDLIELLGQKEDEK